MIFSSPRNRQPTGDEADAAWHEAPKLKARIAELEVALIDLRDHAETAYVSSEDGPDLLAAIERANKVIGVRSVPCTSGDDERG